MKKIQTTTNYGVLTDVSKGLNQFLGDGTGRTVSMRTAQGFKKFFNAADMEDDAAEFIVHGGMIAASALLKSENESNRTTGTILSMALLLLYQSGK